MSSGFVSGGTIDDPAERDDAWRAAQEELAEKRRRKDEAASQNDGKSLYDVLQANKAAKQEAFEEANRLKNQFRALDDDEAEFLDSVLEETRKKEAEVKKETLQQLDAFRKYREEAERRALAEQNAGSPEVEDAQAQWLTGGRKRKKGEKDGALLKGIKLRKASGTADKGEAKPVTMEKEEALKKTEVRPTATTSTGIGAGTSTREQSSLRFHAPKGALEKVTLAGPASPKPSNTLALGLGYTSSDEDD
ncbi:hypothetical protein K491DRAFT_662984 [Lophiostoma macrostomum CBS 122681]|uniref:FAM192A/Fyv6 N-terminal domain-containing protein n=1 Tax=Lophiostoma macrostomum CBS 122681 TaxID=1314788 RepID=A0A6A6T137_9PLEO|nr:hypothetical protein K491DRAFT_662984 [Lophiostoma macrostomum CBS 122681]